MKSIHAIVILLIAATFSCTFQEQSTFKKGKAIICGHSDIQRSELQTLSLNVLGLTEIEGKTYIAFIDKTSGSFRFEIEIAYPQDVDIEYNKMLKVYVAPGDSLCINFDNSFDTCQKSDEIKHVEFLGSHSLMNKTIQRFDDFMGENSFNLECDGKSIEQYKEALSDSIKVQKDKLTQFIEQNNPSEEFVNWASADIIYHNANFLINYMFYLHMNNKPFDSKLFDNTIFPVTNEKALVTSSYRLHLNQYFVFKYFMDSTAQNAINKKDFYTGFNFALNSIVKNEPSGLSRDILVNDLFYRCLTEDPSACVKLKSENISYISDNFLRQEFEKHFNATVDQPKSVEFIGQSNSKDSILGDIFNDIGARSRGKVIYVDFWATWCGPCLSEFPYSHKLQDLYKGEKIEFVNICMESSKDNWENAIKSLKLSGNQYYLNKLQSEILKNKYQIPHFPTYFLISKKGLLINRDAPRPSSADIKDKIDRLLNE